MVDSEQLERLELMASGDPTWDLSDNDREAIAAALRELKEFRWVKVSERLPELDRIVEVIVPAEKCIWLSHALRYMDDEQWLWSFVTEDHICLNGHIPDTEDAEWIPTHWRLLPAPPKEGL